MTTASTIAPARHAPALLGQTVVVIGGSAGIGLETARRAREEGAAVILTARDPDRLRRVGLELGAPASRPSTPPTSNGSGGSSTSCPRRSTMCWSRAPAPTTRRWRSSRSSNRKRQRRAGCSSESPTISSGGARTRSRGRWASSRFTSPWCPGRSPSSSRRPLRYRPRNLVRTPVRPAASELMPDAGPEHRESEESARRHGRRHAHGHVAHDAGRPRDHGGSAGWRCCGRSCSIIGTTIVDS